MREGQRNHVTKYLVALKHISDREGTKIKGLLATQNLASLPEFGFDIMYYELLQQILPPMK